MRKKERVALRPRHYIHIYVHKMSLATSRMIDPLTTHKILNKRRIKGLVCWTRTSVIALGKDFLMIG